VRGAPGHLLTAALSIVPKRPSDCVNNLNHFMLYYLFERRWMLKIKIIISISGFSLILGKIPILAYHKCKCTQK
jgi:hypothetical protein